MGPQRHGHLQGNLELLQDLSKTIIYMKGIRCLLIFTILLIAGCKETDPRWVMWYDEPADEFIEALVIGNGQMGATVYGGTDEELIHLNDLTLWSGEPVDVDADTLAAKEGLEPVRKEL